MSSSYPKTDILCSGLGRINRGYETFAQECFVALGESLGPSLRLFKSAGPHSAQVKVLWNLHRNSRMARVLGQLVQRSAYHVEQWTFCRSYLHAIAGDGPDLIYLSDANLANFLSRARKRASSKKYKILFSNGAPISGPYGEYDHIQQITPLYYRAVLDRGEPPGKHSLVPYGFNEAPRREDPTGRLKIQIRERLGLPASRPIVLSVGWISAEHKRMDYVVREVAAIRAEARPYLLLLGHQDAASQAIDRMSLDLLGRDGFMIRSVPQDAMSQYYQLADVFVLASLHEGFGRVLVEAQLHGLPCIAHDSALFRYVLGAEGTFRDLQQAGELTTALRAELTAGCPVARAAVIAAGAARRFSWTSLRNSYVEMLRRAAYERTS